MNEVEAVEAGYAWIRNPVVPTAAEKKARLTVKESDGRLLCIYVHNISTVAAAMFLDLSGYATDVTLRKESKGQIVPTR